jgi:alkylated DNA repair dioxygenase AlkB
MSILFSIEPQYPSGFSYYPDFISAEEEEQLVRIIGTLQLSNLVFHGYEAKRKVASYGYDYHFDSRSISKGDPVPPGFEFLIIKVAEKLQLSPADLQEVLVTEYPVGSVINWHRDAPPFDIIIGVSLLSDCSFKLRPYDKSKQGRGSIVSIAVKRRSLYVLQGPVREEWEHSIPALKHIRYSITLRTLRK